MIKELQLINPLNNANTTYKFEMSVFTLVDYRKSFNSDIFKDLTDLKDVFAEAKNDTSKVTDGLIKLTQIIYILAKPNLNGESYDRFIQTLPFELLMSTENLSKLIKVISELMNTGNNNTREYSGQ